MDAAIIAEKECNDVITPIGIALIVSDGRAKRWVIKALTEGDNEKIKKYIENDKLIIIRSESTKSK